MVKTTCLSYITPEKSRTSYSLLSQQHGIAHLFLLFLMKKDKVMESWCVLINIKSFLIMCTNVLQNECEILSKCIIDGIYK